MIGWLNDCCEEGSQSRWECGYPDNATGHPFSSAPPVLLNDYHCIKNQILMRWLDDGKSDPEMVSELYYFCFINKANDK